jgi:hypothetical protein
LGQGEGNMLHLQGGGGSQDQTEHLYWVPVVLWTSYRSLPSD